MEADVPQLIAIIQANASAPQWTSAQVLGLFDQGETAYQRAALVVREQGIIIGVAVVSVLAVHPPEAELESIAVLPERQRQGIGFTLLDAAVYWAEKQGAASMMLEVRETNAAALALYARCGFSRTGVRPRYYTKPDEDAVLMKRTLASV